MTLEEYISKLKSHDWWYDRSDDHSVWRRGQDERDELVSAARELDPNREIWNSYDPRRKDD